MRSALVVLLAILLSSVVLAAEPTLLVRVERQSRDDLTRLRQEGVPVIAEFLEWLLVEGRAGELGRLQALGYDTRVLEADSAGAGYLVVPDGPGRSPEELASVGRVVTRVENLSILRVEPGVELPPSLDLGCFSVTWLGRDPLKLPLAPQPRSPATKSATDAPADPLVQQIVDLVDDTAIMDLWVDIADNPPTNTRFSQSIGCEDASQYCYDHYAALGLEPEFDEWRSQDAPNVVAEITGAIDPEGIYILTGHLDDLPSSGPAPGADDNGSGSVTVLEGARVMSCYSYRNTVRFLNVTGEEQGLLGSDAYAEAASARGDDIRGVLNFDMNGWEGDGIPEIENLDVSYNSFSQWLAEAYSDAAATYGTGLSVKTIYCPSLGASDHKPFWDEGYPAFIGITDNQGYCGHQGNYPYYHQSDDTIANNGDPTFFYATVRTAVATLAELAGPFVVTFNQSKYACDGTVEVIVSDEGLNLDPGSQESVQITLVSQSEPAGETITLLERGDDSKLFSATIPLTGSSPVGGDGLLSVEEGDEISADYVDPLDCAGNTDALYTARATVDCSGPLITGVDESGVTGSQATVVWNTDELSDSQILWGETLPPSTPASGNANTTSHEVPLSGLQECTVYYYEVRSTDEAGNTAVANNGGEYFYFETLGDFGDGLQPCHAGQVAIEEPVSSCEGSVAFRVVDLDLNQDPGSAETALLEVISTSETAPELITVTETGPNTSRFEGSITTVTGAPGADGLLQTAHADLVTVTYRDEDDGAGRPGLSFATSEIDCAGPVITGLRVEGITDARARVRFETDEPGDTVVEWGFTDTLGELVEDPAETTSHDVVLNQLTSCVPAFLRVRSRDRWGHETVVANLGAPHSFSSGEIPGLYWKDDFESPDGSWTLQGEWEIGAAEGRGGSSGGPDPVAAYNNLGVLGQDLSGQGAFPGDYEPDTDERATGPTLNATSWSNTKLIIHRKLSVGASDDAELLLWTFQGRTLYRNDGQLVNDADYVYDSWEIGPLVDGSPQVYVQFRGAADASGHYSSWTVDDVIFKDGSLPDYAACGGCAAGPSFEGATGAADLDSCAATGVTISWKESVAWGTGDGGSYAIYRGTSPGFTPSPANLVASGVSGTSYDDTGAPTDQPLYYVVRAENDETCSTGPGNGGLTDGNEERVEVRDWTSRPVPGAILGVDVDRIGGAHLRVSWMGEADSALYRVYRSLTPGDGFQQLGETGELLFDDLASGADLETYFYLVRGTNACGDEGP